MSNKRKQYSVEYKMNIIEDSRGKNLTQICKEKQLDLRMVRKWREQYDDLCILAANGHGRKRKCGAGRRAIYSELEDILFDWICTRRASGLVVRRSQIQDLAIKLAPEFEVSSNEFKASKHWLDNFLQRYHLVLRRSTTLFKLEDSETVRRALAYKSFIDSIDFSKYKLSDMIAMDETAVYMGQETQTTIDHVGATSIYVPSTGYESARITWVLAIRLDGTKVPPMIINKGKKESIERRSGVWILETEKAWATQAALRKWIDAALPRLLRGGQRGLLIWDSASTHRAKDMKSFLSNRRIDQVMIPAGMTAYLQALDISINKPFKDSLRECTNEYIENRMQRNERGNFIKPSSEEVTKWVTNSWERITDDSIAKALKAGYLDKKYPFKESHIAKHERLGPLIFDALKSQNVDVALNHEDISEEDEMEILDE